MVRMKAFDHLQFFAVHFRKIFLAQQFLAAVSADYLNMNRCVGIGSIGILGVVVFVFGWQKNWRAFVVRFTPGKNPTQVNIDPLLLVFDPEEFKRLVEQGDIFPVMHQEGARRVIKICALADIDIPQGMNKIDHAPRIYIQSKTPQQAAK